MTWPRRDILKAQLNELGEEHLTAAGELLKARSEANAAELRYRDAYNRVYDLRDRIHILREQLKGVE